MRTESVDDLGEQIAELEYALAEAVAEITRHHDLIGRMRDLLRRWEGGLVPVGDYGVRAETTAILNCEVGR